MSERFDIVVVGAGIVGLAVARELAMQGAEVLVLERHRTPIQETSSRNSGVIHSGIYYLPGSLKARLCVHGRRLLYSYCDQHGIPFRRCGKVIVAQAGQQASLQALHVRAQANGVDDLQLLTAVQVRDLEPCVRADAGLFSPSTGVVDVHEFAFALLGDLESANGTIAYESVVEAIELNPGDISVRVRSGDETLELQCGALVNAAGLDAVPLLRRMRGYPPAKMRTAYYAKGSYFTLTGQRPFRHLVYPMPNEAGLGIHATLDLDGSVRFGPNVQWVDHPEYSVDAASAPEFYDSIRTYWPELRDGALQPGYAGVRPKLVGCGSPAADFQIEAMDVHGCAGLVNLLGIESPGLTSSLAIGKHVAALLHTIPRPTA